MKLMMLFGNEVIDIIKLRKSNISPARLLNLKQKLIIRNEENLNVASDAPYFAMQDISSGKNTKGNHIII